MEFDPFYRSFPYLKTFFCFPLFLLLDPPEKMFTSSRNLCTDHTVKGKLQNIEHTIGKKTRKLFVFSCNSKLVVTSISGEIELFAQLSGNSKTTLKLESYSTQLAVFVSETMSSGREIINKPPPQEQHRSSI